MFNSYIITPFLNRVRKEIQDSPWDHIKNNMNRIKDLFETIYHNADLTRGLEQGITNSGKTITSHRKELANRVSSKPLERKNFLNYVCALRSVISHGTSNASKQTKRADEIRRVHATMTGYICPIHSADSGENVGTKKNLALTASVVGAGNSYNLKLKLLSDPDVIELKNVKSEDISRQKLSSIYVNGEWIGCCKNGHLLVDRYRKLRREHKTVDRYTTIVWDTLTDKVEFLLDADRLTRPLLIVDNNIEEYKAAKRAGKDISFVQNIRLTKKHINELKSGDITFGDLVEDGIAEYVSPEEQENCWICPSFSELKIHKNNVLNQYTHLEIEAAILGLASHISVLANFTQPARSTYESNQSRQTSGWYAMNFAHRADKNKTWQYYNQTPLCRTITARYIPPNGNNLFVGYICEGNNQEDSTTFDKATSQRGLYSCAYFKKESHELEQDEEFANPDPRRTKNMKSNANYNKLVDGAVPVGTMIVKGDILIGVVMKNNRRGQSNKNVDYEYVDRSIMYKSNEPAVVSKVIDDRGPNHERFITVVLRYQRELLSGDKCLIFAEHDVLTDEGWIAVENVTMQHKVATVNPHGEIEYHHPIRTISYEIDDEVYEIQNTLISQCVTKNHNMYVSKRGGPKSEFQPYKFEEARDIFGKRRKYKMNGINTLPDVEFHCFGSWTIPMDLWLQFLGMWISDGFAHKDHGVAFCVAKQRKIDFLHDIFTAIGVHYTTQINKRQHKDYMDQTVFSIKDKDWKMEMAPLSVGALNKRLPAYVWNLSQNQCRILLDSLISGDGTRGKTYERFFTSSQGLADDVQRLCIHAGYAGVLYTVSEAGRTCTLKTGKVLKTNADGLMITIIKSKLHPEINNGHTKKQNAQIERYVPYKGKVACIEVPNHTFFVRRNGKISITGNCSSRSGNKTIAAKLNPESDMPFMANGITLDLILNSHSVPSRMTIGQLMETTLSKVCARKGISIDVTAFRNITPENLMDRMVENGFRYNGKERMFNGETGRWLDIAIFCGPTYIQKLQKYVLDNGYATSRACPTDATTGQPLSGKAAGGGLRIGEMEMWSLEAHGAEAFTYEKFSQDSDGFKMWVCRRCGHHAIYNERDHIYTCKKCKDYADISIVETTRASVVFQQELAGSNIKLKLGLKPREFEVNA
jgi:DNA-directed RNA polymerase beta subunit